jgi:hypothetical protein
MEISLSEVKQNYEYNLQRLQEHIKLVEASYHISKLYQNLSELYHLFFQKLLLLQDMQQSVSSENL